MAVPKRHSAPAPAVSAAAETRDLKQRVYACLSKLSDRDTQSLAAAELEAIAVSLTPDAVPPFLSCLLSPDAASTKSAVRTHCVRLLSLLSCHHRGALSPFLPKMVAAVIRRLRDPDSAVRSACVSAAASMASQIAAAPFSAILNPLAAALSTEQDRHAQIGSALCLAAAIDSAPDAEPAQLQKFVPKLIKLLKSNSFKPKAALLTLVGSVVAAGGASNAAALRNLVPCVMEFVCSADWAARKAAAEAFLKLAVAETDALSELKPSCLKTFESRRYDKVKVVRDTMNQMVEAWRQIPDVPDEMSPPPRSQSSSKESGTPTKMKQNTASGTRPPSNSSFAASKWERTAVQATNSDTKSAMFGKQADPQNKSDCSKQDMRRALFTKNPDDEKPELDGFKSRHQVNQAHDENFESTVLVSNNTEILHRCIKESEDLSLIRLQLVQIENQQSNLLDLFQRFVGSSQNGMRALETRVHGLELALDEISFDLAVSTGRISNTNPRGTTCCALPGANFLSSRFWRRSASGRPAARLASHYGNRSAGVHYIADRNRSLDAFGPANQRSQPDGFIMNPLAVICNDSAGVSNIPLDRVSTNAHIATYHAVAK